ncbi:MAG: phosphoribosyltransferase [uncultured bacterium (gcode 4)]|uniref:Phosphoribosyltransferase n=1 Tax=uncultured bacterium (gcode 4) TaxID=1234023 RepID=K1XYP3_9BACT|nr:MAG: phosphoribosyltransferase [uncultured bacterium (gcode 4)]
MIARIKQFLSHVFLFPEELIVFQELFVDKNPHYKESLWEYWHLDGTFVALEYTDELKTELEAYKYYSKREKKDIFLPKLLECFELFCLEGIDRDVVITTVPLHFLSHLRRGYNHSEILAKGIAKQEGNTFHNLLRKSRMTKHQAKLDRSGRLRNVRNSFSFRKKYLKTIAWKDIILVDDVVSTGSTANECAGLLKKNGARRVFGLFLATTNTDWCL